MKGKTVGILTFVILAVGILGVAVYISRSPPDNVAWLTSGEISGVGKQDTTEFNITHSWRVIWKIDNDTYDYLLAVYLKESSGYSVVAEVYAGDINATSGVVPVSYTGTFIIRVVTPDDVSWSIKIQEYTSPT